MVLVSNRLTSNERGDTLVEVALAMAILGMVLVGSLAVATRAVQIGQTGRERSQVSDEAQTQAEGLRSFRDNHTWAEFRGGNSPAYYGVDSVPTASCNYDATKRCFHMESSSTAPGTVELTPRPGFITGSVPTSFIEISTDTSASGLAARECDYDFEVHYTFSAQGSSVRATNHIRTRLANLKYAPTTGLGVCL